MAHWKRRLPSNAPGSFFVDASCIDCDTCRWMAPDVFGRAAGQSHVASQPQNDGARLRALEALISCPTASIGTRETVDVRSALAGFPLRVDGPVHHCGFHHEKSFGATSYLVVRPAGNLLIDSPRFAGPLVKRLEALGGVRHLLLTHRDDVADHERFHAHFGCERWLHGDDHDASLGEIEHLLVGGESHVPIEGVRVLPVPGHTRGSVCYLVDDVYLFTGDHLAFSPSLGHLYAFRGACWYSWSRQIESMESLRAWSFEWVLPGHGRRHHGSAGALRAELERALVWMRSVR